MKDLPKGFRIFWLTLTCLAWLSVISLAFHRSVKPDIWSRYSHQYFLVIVLIFGLSLVVSLGNLRTFLKRIYVRRYEIVLFNISCLFALAVAEAYIRTANPLGISYYEEESRYALEKMTDPDLIFRHRPSWRTNYQGVGVSLNEFGLRDEPIGRKENTEYRILVLGDSITFGWGVAQDETFSVRLQKMLTAQLGRPVRVINAGVGGYNTVQEYTFLKDLGLLFDPDLVLLVYTAENDIEFYKGSFDPSSTVERMVLWRSWFYRLASHVFQYGWLGSIGHDYDRLKQSSGWQASMESLRRIATLCERRNVPLAVFYFRWQATPFNTALLKDVQIAASPSPVADIGESFAGKQLSRYVNSQVDSHPNSEGHGVIADNIGKYLLRHDLFPGRNRGTQLEGNKNMPVTRKLA